MNKSFMRMVDQSVWKCLRSRGFERKGTQFWHDLGTGAVHTVDIFRLGWRQPSYGTEFYIECSVRIGVYLEIYPDHVGIKSVREVPAQIRVRLEELFEEWGAGPALLPENITEEEFRNYALRLTIIFEDHVLPWFARFGTPLAVGDFLASAEAAPGHYVIRYREIVQHPDDLRKAAIAYFGAGEYQRARLVLDLATKTIDRSGRHLTVELHERIERLIAQRQRIGART